MAHINKQLRVNFNFTNQNHPESDHSNVELYCTILLILLGFGGLYFYTSILSPKKPNVSFSSLTTNTMESINHEVSSIAVAGTMATKKEKLIIKGHPEAGEKLMLIIEAYDENANYSISFGDGNSKSTLSHKIEHTYTQAGNYTIELSVNYADETSKKLLKEVTIDQPIEVIEEAFTKM